MSRAAVWRRDHANDSTMPCRSAASALGSLRECLVLAGTVSTSRCLAAALKLGGVTQQRCLNRLGQVDGYITNCVTP